MLDNFYNKLNISLYFNVLGNMNIIEAYRINNWYYYLGFILIGFLMSSSFNLNLLINLFLGSFILAYAYSFNDFCDKGRKAYFILPLILSIFILPFLNHIQILLTLIFLFIVTIYSSKTIRLKAKPFISSFCNGIGFTILFLLGYTVKNFDLRGLIIFLLFFCFNMVAQFIHEMTDLKEDRKNGIISTAVFLGEGKIKKICYIFLWSTPLIGFYLFYFKFVNSFFVIITLFFVLFFTYRFFQKKIDKNIRMEYRILGLILGFIYLLLFS
jgi:4-hydroxybenzoate polyprenyltransferase